MYIVSKYEPSFSLITNNRYLSITAALCRFDLMMILISTSANTKFTLIYLMFCESSS